MAIVSAKLRKEYFFLAVLVTIFITVCTQNVWLRILGFELHLKVCISTFQHLCATLTSVPAAQSQACVSSVRKGIL